MPVQGSAPSATPQARPARGAAHLWVPSEIGVAALLLALVLDREHGHPDNNTATGRMLGVHRDTVRAHRDELLQRDLIEVREGFLVGTTASRALLARSSPLPRVLLRGTGRRPSLPVLFACAVVYADAVGWNPQHRYVRTDAQRAVLAGVAESTVRTARRLLVARGLVGVEQVQRGRAGLRRVTRTEGSCATHGQPMAEARADRLAVLALRGRARFRRGAEQTSSVGAEPSAPPIQSPSGTAPMQGPSPRPAGGSRSLRDLNGCPDQVVEVPIADQQQHRRRDPVPVANVLAELVPSLPAASEDRSHAAAVKSDRAVAELCRIAGDQRAVLQLAKMPTTAAIEQLLAAAGVYDTSPKRRVGFALQVGRVLDVHQVLALALDVVLGRPRSVPAVLRRRLERALAGENPTTHCRAGWPIGRFLDAVGRDDEPTIRLTYPAPVDAHALRQRADADRRRDVGRVLGGAATGPSFDDVLRNLGLGDFARRNTA